MERNAVDPADARRALARALVAKLTEAQQALPIGTSSLAWAASENEAVEWARALVGLLGGAHGARPVPAREAIRRLLKEALAAKSKR